MVKKLTVSDEAYWKLMEVKVKLRCETWEEFADRIRKMVFKNEKSE
jgi:predicted CopG family antitoxin